MSKLTKQQKIEIYKRRKAGRTVSSLVHEYSINQHNVEYLIRLIDKHGYEVLNTEGNKHYSKEYKEKAIKRVLIGLESKNSVSIDLGLSSSTLLNSWIKSYEENCYNVVERKRGRHGKERTKDSGRTSEGNRRIEVKKCPPDNRERIHKKIKCLSYGTKEERVKEIVRAITELRQETKCSLAFILDTINSNPDLPHIAKSVYYYTLSKADKDDKNDEIMVEIINIFYENKGYYGYRRIHMELLNKGYKISHSKVKRLMSKMKLYGKNPAQKQRYNSYKGDMNGVCSNLLLEKKYNRHTKKINEKRNFKTTSVNQKWTTDISEFKIAAGKLYLSPILDMHNREIVSYDISTKPDLSQISRMLNDAFSKHTDLTGLIFHSDQGWQYQHYSYHQFLLDKGIKQSMSRKGNCLDNSPMENFFGKMKNEMFYGNETSFNTLEELKQEMTEYIKYYNENRIQIKLKGLTPLQVRNQALVLS